MAEFQASTTPVPAELVLVESFALASVNGTVQYAAASHLRLDYLSCRNGLLRVGPLQANHSTVITCLKTILEELVGCPQPGED
jgi:hypothetical protein